MDLVNKCSQIPISSKVTVKVEGIFGNEIIQKATYLGNIKQHGFLSANSGSWGLYKTNDSETPCYTIDLRFYKKRYISVMKLKFSVLDIEQGW